LRGAGVAGAALLLPRWASGADDGGGVKVSIFHTTDLHGHIIPTESYEGVGDLGGLARCAAQIRQWREESPNHLLIDVGDVYQGTDVGYRTRGKVMVDCLNALRYDAWVVGNHEFDWGIDPFVESLQRSSMPVLAANASLEGRASGTLDPARTPFGKVAPFLLKEVAGFRIGVVGVTTPGLPYWFQPAFIKGFEPTDPIEAVRRAVAELTRRKADAIVLAVHMGTRSRGDDFANHVDALTKAFPATAVVLAGHTHKDIPNQRVNGVLYTQANYFGLNAGRVDLVFDPNTRKLIGVQADTKRMDSSVALDPQVMSLAQADLDASAKVLETPAGKLLDPFSVRSAPGKPSDVERLIATSVAASLAKRGVKVDGVLHGLFSDSDVAPGDKTIGDLWKILPYENFIITGDLSPEELAVVMGEIISGSASKNERNLMGFQVRLETGSGKTRLLGISDANGAPLQGGRRYRIAMNTFDASSGGQRMMKLREIMRSPAARATLQPVQTRDALIDYFADRGSAGVGLSDLKAV